MFDTGEPQPHGYTEQDEERAIAELVAAASEALASDGGLAYGDSDDDVGYHACCFITARQDHALDCWVPRLRKAIEQVKRST